MSECVFLFVFNGVHTQTRTSHSFSGHRVPVEDRSYYCLEWFKSNCHHSDTLGESFCGYTIELF